MQVLYDGVYCGAIAGGDINTEQAIAMIRMSNPSGLDEIDPSLITISPFTESEIKAHNEGLIKNAKLEGVEFNGVMCSATGEDQNGLDSLLLTHTILKLNGQKLPDNYFHFKNGNVLTINSENIEALMNIWKPFRSSFFPPPITITSD